MPSDVLEKLCLLVTTAVTSAWCACSAAQPTASLAAPAVTHPQPALTNGNGLAILLVVAAVVILDAWLVLRGVARARRQSNHALTRGEP